MSDFALKDLFIDTLDLTGWTHFRVKENYEYGGVSIPGLRQTVYHKTIDGVLVSVGVFYYQNSLTYLAWGFKEAMHCSFHAVVSLDGRIIRVVDGCPDVVPIKDTGGIVVGFTLDGVLFPNSRGS